MTHSSKTKLIGALMVAGVLVAPLSVHSKSKASDSRAESYGETWADTMSKPIALPSDSRIVKFSFSPDVIYTILTTVGYTTHLELQEDEGVTEDPSLGDTLQWRVSGGPRNIFIKPLRPDIVTSLTLVTNKRSYQFDLRSGPIDGKRYQKAYFEYPDEQQKIKLKEKAVAQAIKKEEERIGNQVLSKEVNPSKLNFSYDVKGDAEFRPISVFDDGKFTYFKLSNAVQSLPALFLIEQGDLILVNYIVKGDTLVVERVSPKFSLKLGDKEVLVSKPSSWWN